MRKNLFLLLCFVFTSVAIAQSSVSINGATSIEVGQLYNYNIKFNPVYPYNSYGDQADDFVITLFSIQTGTNGASGTVQGSINGTPNSSYFSDATFDSSGDRQVGIKWSSGGVLSDDMITAKFTGYYRISSTNEVVGYFNYVTGTLNVNIQRLHTPVTISGPANIADCAQSNVIFSLTNASSINGNKYLWSVTGGVVVGSSTGTSVTIQPNLTGSVTATCQVRRTAADQNYYVSGSKTISRTPFTSSATITGNNTICSSQTYTITGLQTGETVIWSLANNNNEASLGVTTGTTTTVTKTGGGSVTLRATITNSCGTQSVVKSKELFAGSPPPVFWRLGLQEDHRCDTKYHYVPIIFKIPVGVTLTFQYMSPSVTYGIQNIGFEEYLYTFQFPKAYSGYFDFFARLSNSCGYSIKDVYQEINISSCAELGLESSITMDGNDNNFIIYPNPAKNFVTIELIDKGETLDTNDIFADLYDLTGTKKLSLNLSKLNTLNTDNLPKGVYILQILKDGKTERHQIIIE